MLEILFEKNIIEMLQNEEIPDSVYRFFLKRIRVMLRFFLERICVMLEILFKKNLCNVRRFTFKRTGLRLIFFEKKEL
jgi:hypothetical protein